MTGFQIPARRRRRLRAAGGRRLCGFAAAGPPDSAATSRWRTRRSPGTNGSQVGRQHEPPRGHPAATQQPPTAAAHSNHPEARVAAGAAARALCRSVAESSSCARSRPTGAKLSSGRSNHGGRPRDSSLTEVAISTRASNMALVLQRKSAIEQAVRRLQTSCCGSTRSCRDLFYSRSGGGDARCVATAIRMLVSHTARVRAHVAGNNLLEGLL